MGLSRTCIHFSPTPMGSQAIQFLSQFPIPISHVYHRPLAYDNYSTNKTRRRRWQCFSGGGSRWEWEKNVNPNQRSRFSEACAADDYDEEDEFGFRNAKRRTWWSDDLYGEDDDDDDDEEEDEGFGILEASIGLNWVRKAFQAFGWMIPGVIISLVLGTGQNSIIMALALPLAQSVLSLVVDTLWGKPEETLRTKSKHRKRPSTRSPGRTRMRKEKENLNQTRNGTSDYKSWVDTNDVSSKTKKSGPQNFGGWDELDNHVRAAEKQRKQQR